MKEKEINLDGATSGIVALNENGEIIKFGNYNELSLFKNIHLLESVMERDHKSFHHLGICINKDIIPMNKILKDSDYYEYFDNENDMVSYIYPENKEKIIMCGYLNFGDTPCERTTNKEEGKAFSKYITEILSKNLCYQQRNGILKSGDHIHGHLFNIHGQIATKLVYGNTLILRFMKPYDLLQINNMRNNCELRVLPFKKEFDNYKNLYFCISRDVNEFPGEKIYYDTAYSTLDSICDYFSTVYPELNVKYDIIMFGKPFEL